MAGGRRAMIRKIYESVISDGEGVGGGVQRWGENRVEAGALVCLFGGCMGNGGAAAISMLMLASPKTGFFCIATGQGPLVVVPLSKKTQAIIAWVVGRLPG